MKRLVIAFLLALPLGIRAQTPRTAPVVPPTTPAPSLNPAPPLNPVPAPTSPVTPPTAPLPTTPVVPSPVPTNQGVLPGTVPVLPGLNPTNPATNPKLPPGAGSNNRSVVPDGSGRILLNNQANLPVVRRTQINRLANQLNMFRAGTQTGAAQRNQLMNGFLAAAGNPASPVPPASLRLFAENLNSALSPLTWTPQQRAQLATDLNLLFYSAKLSPTDTQLIIDDAQNLFRSMGVNSESMEALAADLARIGRDLQRSGVVTSSSVIPTQP